MMSANTHVLINPRHFIDCLINKKLPRNAIVALLTQFR